MLKMGYRRQIVFLAFLPFVFVVTALYVDFVAGYVRVFNESVENFLGYFSIAILLSLLPLLFLKEEVYKTWRRFAMVALPIGILFIATSPTNVGGDFGFSSDLNKEGATILFSVLFTFISYLLIITKSFSLRGK